MSKPLSVVIFGVLLLLHLSSFLNAYNDAPRQSQFKNTLNSGITPRYRPLLFLQHPVLSHSSNRHVCVLHSTDDSVEDPGSEKAPRKLKRKRKETSEMMRFSEEIVKPWSLSDSFNSTTMKFIFGLKDGVSGGWAKVESKFASWILIVTSKVDRDIKLTFKTGDIIKRKIKKETKMIFSGVSEVSKPFLALPAAVQKLSDQKDLWGLVRVGVNPLGEERMLDNFNAKNTKERARLPKKKAVPMLAADSVYRSVRMLPNKLKYDYERKKIAQGIKKNEMESRQSNLLSDGENDYDEDEGDENEGDGGGGMRRVKRRGGRIPLLPDSIYSGGGIADSRSREGYDDDGDVIEYESTGSGSYDILDSMGGSYSDSDGGGSDGDCDSDSDSERYKQQERRRTKRVVMKITEEDASASVSLIQALTAFSSEVIEGGELMKLKKEFSWAVSVAQETLDLEILESGKRSNDRATAKAAKAKVKEYEKEDDIDKEKEEGMEADKEREEVVLEDSTTQVTDGDSEGDEELRRWGMERLISSRDTFLDAIEICDRLEELPVQLKGIGKEKGRERVLRLRVGDIEGLRRGVEAFVGGIPAPAGTSSDSGSSSSSGVSGWGGGQTGVVDRIIGNRPLLAGIYGITNGLEETLNQQRDRMEHRDYDVQSSDDSRGVGSVNERAVWRDTDSSATEQAQAQAEAQQRDGMRGETEVEEDVQVSGVVPEGLVKETKIRSDDSEALIKGNAEAEAEEGRVSMNDEAEREVAVAFKTPSPPSSPPLPSAAVWSPGSAVIPVSISPTPSPPPPPAAVSVTGTTGNQVTSADAADAVAVASASQQRTDVTSDASTVVENRGSEGANTKSYRAPSHQDIDGKEKEKVVDREVQEEVVDDVKSDDGSKEGLRDVYFLSIIGDSNNNDKQYSSSSRSSSSRSRVDGGSGGRDSSVFDTTIESTRDRDADQIILFLTTSLDVMFFLLETIAKASGPIILGGGAVAVERASDALFADTVSPKSFLKKKSKKKDKDRDKNDPKLGTESLDSRAVSDKDATVKTWKLLSEFKQQI